VDALIVEVRRNGVLEAVHRVHAVAVRDGAVVRAAGDPSLTCFMRSASKPIQALPLVRARHDLTPEDIAIACASHRATPEQLQAARALLAKAGATEDDLELGLQADRPPHKIYNNCSGKHAGMLALCRASGWPAHGYHEPQHPVQQACAQAHAEAVHVDPREFATAADGCGVVTFGMPLERMALAFANLPQLPEAHRVTHAMRARPDLIGGEDGADVLLLRERTGTYVAKGGAEGLLCVTDLETQTGFAFKQEDGGYRALTPAVGTFLSLASLQRVDVFNTRGEKVGDISCRTGDA
jgi:L-asparaginase